MRKPEAIILAVSVFILLVTGCGLSGSRKPNVILISIDTLRADHMSCYGYSRNTTPVLDSLTAEGVIFTSCQAQSPWTLPSHASMFTGLSVVSHRTGFFNGEYTMLDTNLASLPIILNDCGYMTVGFVNVEFLSQRFGFDIGFDHYWLNPDNSQPAEVTINEVISWMDDEANLSEPFFLFLHFWDVHCPYDPPAPFDTLYTHERMEAGTKWSLMEEGGVEDVYNLELFIARYDGCISYTDQQLGRLFARLRQSDIADKTIIILTADHGEEFLEHGGVYHGSTLYQELLHVPLIISGPGVASEVTNTFPCGLFDIFPTTLSLLDLPCPSTLEGIDLFSSQANADRVIPASGVTSDEPELCNLAAVRRGFRKLIIEMDSEAGIMFDLSIDPAELVPMEPDTRLIEDAQYYWTTPPLGNPENVSKLEIEDQLRGLGYIR